MRVDSRRVELGAVPDEVRDLFLELVRQPVWQTMRHEVFEPVELQVGMATLVQIQRDMWRSLR